MAEEKTVEKTKVEKVMEITDRTERSELFQKMKQKNQACLAERQM